VNISPKKTYLAVTHDDRRDEELGRLFRQHSPALTQHLTRMLRSAALAQEVCQDTYVRLCSEHAETLRALKSPRAFIFKVGVRLAIDRIRSAKRDALLAQSIASIQDSSEHRSLPEPRAMLDESIRHLGDAIEALTPGLRQVFVMRYVRHMAPMEISERLGISMSAYQQRITAANEQLAQRLAALGVDPRAFD
jgi:RNA polymerase sigma factor (sigma-70 family)